jgi:hypothetical protein
MFQTVKNLGIIVPKYIIFKNCIRLQMFYGNNHALKAMVSFPEADMRPTMKSEELECLAEKSGKKVDFNHFNARASSHYALIMEAIEKYPSKREELVNDILNHTFFCEFFEKWNITNLVRKYGLTSFDVFHCLVNGAEPFGLGTLAHKSKYSRESILDDFTKACNANKYAYFDYWNGIGVKSSFPVDVCDDSIVFCK